MKKNQWSNEPLINSTHRQSSHHHGRHDRHNNEHDDHGGGCDHHDDGRPAGEKRRHHVIVASDFWPTFLGIAIISATSLFFQATLPRGARAEVSRHEVQEELKAEGLIK